MARLTIETMECLEHAERLFGELAGAPKLTDPVIRDIRKLRDRITRQINDLRTSLDVPMHPDLVSHVMIAHGINERQAAARIRNRRSMHLCEWCGCRAPDQPEDYLLTCELCRREHAEALAEAAEMGRHTVG